MCIRDSDWKRRRPVSPPEFPTSISATSAESYPITHNVTRQRFESLAGVPPLASLSYVIEGERVILDHTFVPDELRGRGIAAVSYTHLDVYKRQLVHVPDATRRIHTGDLVVVDALAGRAFINPQADVLRRYDRLEADLQVCLLYTSRCV